MREGCKVVSVDHDGDVAIVTIDNPPVNALSADVRDGLFHALSAAIADPDVAAIVYRCAGATFVAGGDIGALGSRQGGAPTMEINRLQESSPKPIVAAMHGSALGGGLETTLAAHGRVAARDAMLGLPEVKLGIVPGAGGTQRLPRLIGFEAALEIIVSGEAVTATKALDLGLVDVLAEPDHVTDAAVALARRLVTNGRGLPRARDIERSCDPKLLDAYLAASSDAQRGAEAPRACVRSVRAALDRPFDEGLQIEREILHELIPSLQSRAMRHIFFAEREAWKLPDASRDTVAPAIRKVAVLAESRDGTAVARAFEAAGLDVAFASTDASALAEADLLFDPGFGSLSERRTLLAQMIPQAREDAILSTMAAGEVDDLFDPARTLGVHFFYPADERPFVEVIRPARASGANLLAVLRLLKRMGKKAVVAAPAPGAIAGRMMSARQRAAELLVANGRSTPVEVDSALVEFGFAEGVFAWLDRIGLDTAWLATGDAGDAVRARLCAAGRTGRAAGAGFYDYGPDGSPQPSLEALAIIGAAAQPLPASALLDALLLPIANEGLKLVESGTATRPSDIDLVAVAAHGWPAWRGGPLFYLDQEADSEQALALLARLLSDHSEFYSPAKGLRMRAAAKNEMQIAGKVAK